MLEAKTERIRSLGQAPEARLPWRSQSEYRRAMAARRYRPPTVTDILHAVVRQALVMPDLTADDVLDQIVALGRGDLVSKVRAELRVEARNRPNRGWR